MTKFRTLLFIFLIGILFYTRFVNLGWGLPYPMHPDERNMANAVQQLNCKIQPPIASLQSLSSCLNPHFFAYGQFPLYLAYFGILLFHIVSGINTTITFNEATIALRIISAIASVINVWVILKMIEMIQVNIKSKIKSPQFAKGSVRSKQTSKMQVKNQKFLLFDFLPVSLTFAFCLLTFSPYFIQFSHFGTTESLLMLFYSLIILFSLKIISSNKPTTNNQHFIYLSIISGLALATKISSVVFLSIPIISIITSGFWENRFFFRLGKPKGRGTHRSEKKSIRTIVLLFLYLSIALIVSLIFSPHNLISFKDFFSSFQYESSVALGKYIAFYTKQFVFSIPIWFQITNIFPYVLGWPQFILFILGFFFLPWKNARINLLRFSFLIYFLPNAFVFTKWTRFMAPIFPIMSLFAILFVGFVISNLKSQISNIQLKFQRFYFLNYLSISSTIVLYFLIIVPGIAFLSIYTSTDVRFTASNWIYKHVTSESKILSETANVIDLPIQSTNNQRPTTNYQYVSFDFYNLDTNIELQNQLSFFEQSADYIFVPSRRIFSNHTCINLKTFPDIAGNYPKRCISLEDQYTLLNKYYNDLFSGRLGFEKVAEFSSYPKIQLFGKTIVEFPDEEAEESWSVFDHPVIRIYKRIQNSEFKIQNNIQNQLDFSNYQTTNYQLPIANYRLLIADTPEKWDKGLMYVQSKEDIDGLDGMLFKFPTSEIRTFWNKNTVSDLTLYWINNQEVMGISDLPSIKKSNNIVMRSSPSEVDVVIEIIK